LKKRLEAKKMNQLDERIEKRIQTIRSDLVQRVENATSDACPLLKDREDPAAQYPFGGSWHKVHDGCCVLNEQGLDKQCYVAQGHTTAKEACPIYLRVLEQLKQ